MRRKSGSVRASFSSPSCSPFISPNNQVSGGFATVHPNNKLTINAVEAAPLDAFSVEVCIPCVLSSPSPSSQATLQAVRANLQEALKVAAGNGSEEDKVEARIEADVFEALQHALAK